MHNPPKLSLGSVFQLAPQEQAQHNFNARLIGYLESHTLLLHYDPAHAAACRPGQHMLARFSEGDNRFAFVSEVKAVCRHPFPYLHLAYPRGVQGIMLRRSQRLPLGGESAPVIRLDMNDGRQHLLVTLADISPSGARLSASRRLGDIDDRFAIEMQPAGHETPVKLPCVVRYVRREPRGEEILYHHGVQFNELDTTAQDFIDRFIRDTINRQRQPIPA